MLKHTNFHKSLPQVFKLAAITTSLLALSGCATLEPEALTTDEIVTTVQTDRAKLAQDVEPVTAPISLEEAIARAIRHNADRRARAMEEAVATGTLEVGNYDLLPKLVAQAGYHSRDQELISRSKDSVTGAPSLAHPFISSSKNSTTTDLGFSWSLLDFGQSYYAAKQNADRVLIAQERRRKALHTLIQDVRTAYWRVVAAQKLSATIRSTISDAEGALQDAQKAEAEKIRSPLEPLRYQRQLLESIRLLESIEQELSTAKVELATLVNLPAHTTFEVVEPVADINTRWLDVSAESMEEFALLRNPDLREGIYNSRIAQQETRRALLKIFPGISFNYSNKTSNDPYLINQNWNEAGAQISFNLLGVLSAPAQMRLADAGVGLADQRRMATQMAVISQLHIARLGYANTVHQLKRADAIAKLDDRMAEHLVNQEKAAKQSKLDRVAQQTTAILSQLRRYQALSNAQAAASRLQATLGLEPAIEGSDQMTLAQLTSAIGASLKGWEAGQLPTIKPAKAPAKVAPAKVEAAAPVVETSAVAAPEAATPVAAPVEASTPEAVSTPAADTPATTTAE